MNFFLNDPTLVAPLNHLGVIEVSGADAETFLQGQLSNDLRELGPARVQLSSLNSPKGRMLAVVHLFRDGQSIFLELHRGVLDATLKRLRMYVLRSKVKLDDASGRREILGLGGAGAGGLLRELDLPAPAGPLELAWSAGTAVMRRQGAVPRYTLCGSPERLQEIRSRVARQTRLADSGSWRLLEMEAGLPTVYPETSDHFVPQMCNLDTLGGISFNKGCYTGQEIVARVHYRGAVKRRMILVRTEGETPVPGSRITLPDSGNTGEVVDAARHPDGHNAVLVVASDLAG